MNVSNRSDYYSSSWYELGAWFHWCNQITLFFNIYILNAFYWTDVLKFSFIRLKISCYTCFKTSNLETCLSHEFFFFKTKSRVIIFDTNNIYVGVSAKIFTNIFIRVHMAHTNLYTRICSLFVHKRFIGRTKGWTLQVLHAQLPI